MNIVELSSPQKSHKPHCAHGLQIPRFITLKNWKRFASMKKDLKFKYLLTHLRKNPVSALRHVSTMLG